MPTVAQLNLVNGELKGLFTPPPNGWLASAAVSPNGQTIILGFAPPPPGQGLQFGYTGLYAMPGDGSAAPQPVLDHTPAKESHFSPVWSPDGAALYFGHFQPVTNTQGVTEYRYMVERWHYPDGPIEVVAENAFWPCISSDGRHIAYVSTAPENYGAVIVADADGGNPVTLGLPAGMVVDAPLFSPDGQWLYFSGADLTYPTPQPSATARSLWDRWFGVQAAEAAPPAHQVPSEWWRVPLTGGDPERLTWIYDMGLYGDFSPDGRHFVFVSVNGLFVMNPDGTGLTVLAYGTGTYGTVEWLP